MNHYRDKKILLEPAKKQQNPVLSYAWSRKRVLEEVLMVEPWASLFRELKEKEGHNIYILLLDFNFVIICQSNNHVKHAYGTTVNIYFWLVGGILTKPMKGCIMCL